jgi:hypothetical protein
MKTGLDILDDRSIINPSETTGLLLTGNTPKKSLRFGQMRTLSPEASFQTDDRNNAESNVIDFAAHQKAIGEVQNCSIRDYKASIESMEKSSSGPEKCLPGFDISFSCVQHLTQAGIAVRELLAVGIPVCELLAVGFMPSDLLAAGVYAGDLIAAGVSGFALGQRLAG